MSRLNQNRRDAVHIRLNANCPRAITRVSGCMLKTTSKGGMVCLLYHWRQCRILRPSPPHWCSGNEQSLSRESVATFERSSPRLDSQPSTPRSPRPSSCPQLLPRTLPRSATSYRSLAFTVLVQLVCIYANVQCALDWCARSQGDRGNLGKNTSVPKFRETDARHESIGKIVGNNPKERGRGTDNPQKQIRMFEMASPHFIRQTNL